MIRFKGGTVVSAAGLEKRDLYAEGGRIVPPGPADQVVDVSGCLLFPGFIDAHTHMDMPVSGTVTADSFPSGTAAAVAGGTTVILDFATQDRGGTLAQALETWHTRADGRCFCDYGFHMAVTDWNDRTREEMSQMVRAGVTSFKGYMAYDNLRLSDGDMAAFLAEAGRLGAFVGCHCELGDMVNQNAAALLAAGQTGPEAHPRARPNEVEALAVRRFLELAREAGGLPWVVHLSTREGLQEIDKARRAGQTVLTETCPQYLTLTEEAYARPDFEGAKFVCSPPIRSAADRDALSRAVEERKIDILSTDHCSFNFRGQKELGRGDFTKIPNGLPGVEFRPAVIWSRGVTPGHITAPDMCRLMCETPAKAFGLWGRKGALTEGFDADIVVWDPRYRGILDPRSQETACDYSPWEGMELTGRARAVYLRGELAARDGKCLRSAVGEYLSRKPAMPA